METQGVERTGGQERGYSQEQGQATSPLRQIEGLSVAEAWVRKPLGKAQGTLSSLLVCPIQLCSLPAALLAAFSFLFVAVIVVGGGVGRVYVVPEERPEDNFRSSSVALHPICLFVCLFEHSLLLHSVRSSTLTEKGAYVMAKRWPGCRTALSPLWAWL